MSDIYGALGVNTTDSQYAFVRTFGQDAIYSAVNKLLGMYEQDLNASIALLVEETTVKHKEKYLLPGGGRMQLMGPEGEPIPSKATGSWDVAYPIDDFGSMLSWSRVAYAYMTMQDLDRHMKSIQVKNINTVRHQMLEMLFNANTRAYTDPEWGSLTIQPLANGDANVYPPILGSETEATSNHYLGFTYASTAISNTNNPFPTIVNKLEDHFGTPTGGSNVIVFINNAQTSIVSQLADFVPFTYRYTQPGADADLVAGLPPEVMAGSWRILGTCSGAIIAEWRWVPSQYMLAVHLDAPKPLKKRIDPPDVGLGQGLQLVAKSEKYPFTESVFSNRYGFGCGNRLNGVMGLVDGNNSYATPAGY